MNFFFQYVAPKLYDYSLSRWGDEHEARVCFELNDGGDIEYCSISSAPNKAWQEALLKLIGEGK